MLRHTSRIGYRNLRSITYATFGEVAFFTRRGTHNTPDKAPKNTCKQYVRRPTTVDYSSTGRNFEGLFCFGMCFTNHERASTPPNRNPNPNPNPNAKAKARATSRARRRLLFWIPSKECGPPEGSYHTTLGGNRITVFSLTIFPSRGVPGTGSTV